MGTDTIGSIANFISETLDNLPQGVSGNLVIITDMARQHVENYVGKDIGSNSIPSIYQPAIIDFAKADAIDMATGQGANDELKLAELSTKGNAVMSADAFRQMGENKLKAIGMKRRFARSLS